MGQSEAKNVILGTRQGLKQTRTRKRVLRIFHELMRWLVVNFLAKHRIISVVKKKNFEYMEEEVGIT